MPKKTAARESKKPSGVEGNYWRAGAETGKGARICRSSPKRVRRMRSLSLVALRLADSPARDEIDQHRSMDEKMSLQANRRESMENRRQEIENRPSEGVQKENLKINCNIPKSLRLMITKEKCILTPIRANTGDQERAGKVLGTRDKGFGPGEESVKEEPTIVEKKAEKNTREKRTSEGLQSMKLDETKGNESASKGEDSKEDSEISDKLLEKSGSSVEGYGFNKDWESPPEFRFPDVGLPNFDGAPIEDSILADLDPDFLGSLLESRGHLPEVPLPSFDEQPLQQSGGLKSNLNLMLTDTEQYKYKSAFKDLNESMRQFDEYTGLALPTNQNHQSHAQHQSSTSQIPVQPSQQQSRYPRQVTNQGFDITEAYAEEVKKRYYRKKLVNESLDSWYRYNYGKWLESFQSKCSESGDEEDPPWVMSASPDSSSKLAERIWNMNARFKTMDIPSLEEILDTDIENVRCALMDDTLSVEENPANIALLEVTSEANSGNEYSSMSKIPFFNRTFEPSEFLGSSTPIKESEGRL